MNQSLKVLILASAYAIGCSALAASLRPQNVGFAAPSVTSSSSVNYPEAGAIIYDSTAGAFKGNAGVPTSPSWVTLSTNPMPAGVVIMTAASSCPSGTLAADGSAISRTAYAGLFSAMGTTYGPGDGSTTFNLPNAQGVFVRGAGTQTISSISYSGTQGTTQGDQLQGLKVPVYSSFGASLSSAGGTRYLGDNNGGTNLGNVNSGTPISDGTNGTPRTGSETRPANIVLLYCVATGL
jgi:hypothetical protein